MDAKSIADKIQGILPDRPEAVVPQAPGATPPGAAQHKSKQIKDAAKAMETNLTAKALAEIKYKEKQKIKQIEAKAKDRERFIASTGVPESEVPLNFTQKEKMRLKEHQDNIKAAEAIEAATSIANPGDALDVGELAKVTPASEYQSVVQSALKLQGISRPDMARLLSALNINLSVRLSKQDTANLLACLLTCNESQLQALQGNAKVPVVIKTVIKRLLDDMKLGETATIERIWDRIFGKGAMQLDLPEEAQVSQGIIPNTPVSREAYIIIRDTLIK